MSRLESCTMSRSATAHMHVFEFEQYSNCCYITTMICVNKATRFLELRQKKSIDYEFEFIHNSLKEMQPEECFALM